jgi:protein-glutamine gamma-glutamyltransferase
MNLNWRTLPREARDTLFLLAVIGWTILPHLTHLPPWCGLMSAAMLGWRARLALTHRPLPPRWVLVVSLGVAVALTLWSFRTLLGKEPGIAMAVVLMSLKTLELRARRDAFVVFFLGFFLVLTHFLVSQSLSVAAAMLLSVWGLLTALVLAHMPVGQPSLRQAGGLAARTALLGAPIMVLLFVLFPRIGPLWGVPQDMAAKSGLSGTMRMGSVAQVALDDSIALRIRFDGAAPPPESLYFRGPVLSRFDGVEWRAGPPSFTTNQRARANLRVTGPSLGYEMTLEPTRLPQLPLLEATLAPPEIQGLRVFMTEELQFMAIRPIFERVRFSATAHINFRHGPEQATQLLRNDVDLPAGYNPRTLAWAAEMRRDPRYAQADGRTLAQAVMQHIRSGDFSYTLAPGEFTSQHSIDEFWFDRRSGFCEHFAAAFVVVMRALDVPARVVTGYQGADPTPVDGYYLVRQSSAHAWAEYWQDGVGWIRADPTAAVAPERIERSLNLRPPLGLFAGAVSAAAPELLAQMRAAWEAVNNRWNQAVLNYSRGEQLDLMRSLGVQSPSWEDLALLLTGSLSALALAGAAWAWWDRQRVDPWARQMRGLRRALANAGLASSESEPPRRLAQRVRQQFGAAGEALAALLLMLELHRYGPHPLSRPDRRLTRDFRRAAKRLKLRAN